MAIEEDYVSFEIAKLLKEKGFTGDEIHKYYNVSDEKPILYSESYIHEFDKDFWITDLIMAPTLQMVMKWLREVHNFHVDSSIYTDTDGDNEHEYTYTYWDWFIFNSKSGRRIAEPQIGCGRYDSYEQAAEAAIKYCLEKLI